MNNKLKRNPYIEVEGDEQSENMSETDEAKEEETRKAFGMKRGEKNDQGRKNG